MWLNVADVYDYKTRLYDPDLGRFQYTGQIWLAEAGLYHDKARADHPGLGRFLQTDPIGYADGLNLYAYVGNDPINATDPSGLRICPNGEPCDEVPTFGIGPFDINTSAGQLAFGDGIQSGNASGISASSLEQRLAEVDEIVVQGVRPRKLALGTAALPKNDHRIDNEPCAELRAYVAGYAESDQIAASISAAIDRTSAVDFVLGTSGNRVSQAGRYTLTGIGWIDLKHAVSAGNSLFGALGIAHGVGAGVELVQILVPGVGPLKSFHRSGGLRSDFRSNFVGQAAAFQTWGRQDTAQNLASLINSLGPVSKSDATAQVATQCGG